MPQVLQTMKYFREYPWGLQLFLFLMMGYTMMGFGEVMAIAFLPKLVGVTMAEVISVNLNSPLGLVNIAVLVQGFVNLTSFFAPTLIFAYLAHPRPLSYVGMRAPGNGFQLLLAITLMLGATPLLMILDSLISQINFGPEIKKMQATSEATMSAFLHITSLSGFFKVFCMMAIFPALGEEVFFRGVFMRFLKKRNSSMVIPILGSAFFFSIMHFNVYGFISIFMAGILLAVIYNLTGSIWCSIAAHMFFNGFQVILSYLGNTNNSVKAFVNDNSVPYGLLIGGMAVSAFAFYLLLKYKTPLPANWTDDFEGKNKYPDFDFGRTPREEE